MSTVMVKETTVYTLSELKERFGASVYDHAIDQVLGQEWEWFEPSVVTEDLEYMIKEDFPLFELDRATERYANGKSHDRPYLYWDMDRLSCEARGTVAVAQFMTEMKLRKRFRLLWSIMSKHGIDGTASTAFGSGRRDNVDLSDLFDELVYADETPYRSQREKAIDIQINDLEAEIESYTGKIYSFVLQHLRAEHSYRCSEEFAVEEAEAHEWTFTEEGDLHR